MSRRAVIFDLDGTLADTIVDIGNSMNRCLARLGQPQQELTIYPKLVGEGAAKLALQALPAEQAELQPVLLAAFLDDYGRHCCEQTTAYPGIPELLTELRRRGLPLAVLSNKPHPMVVQLLGWLFPQISFAAAAGQRPGVPRKPDPTAALAITAELGLAPADFLFVGDSPVDVKTARAAGMMPIGVCWGYRPPEELRAAGAERLLTTPAELLELL